MSEYERSSLEQAYDQIILPLEKFRKEHIGAVKEGRKKFDKQTAKFCLSQERYLALSTKKQDTVLKEADAALAMEQRHFVQASLEYVFLLQEVQERKKFEFVETLLGFMYGWLTFYHQGHEVANDFKPIMNELQQKLQKTRANFEATRDQTELLMKKILEKSTSSVGPNKMATHEGYLYLMEKKAFGTTWTKQYCMYHKDTKEFTMLPYSQATGKFSSSDKMIVTSCIRRMSESIEKRFCFDITAKDRPGVQYTLQALSEEDRKMWMDAMDGKEPTYAMPGKVTKPEEGALDDVGFNFVNRCIEVLESRGLEEQGLYRLVGLGSKVNKLLQMGLDRRKSDSLSSLDDPYEWESKTITSALKTYLRNLPEPLMTFRYHNGFIAAAKQEPAMRVQDVHTLVHRLPPQNFKMLDILIKHLKNVSAKCDKNFMTVSNVSMCFGPTLLRPEEETVAAIMDIKFYNVVVEVLIQNYEKIFKTRPEPTSNSPRQDVQSSPPLTGNGTAPNHVQETSAPVPKTRAHKVNSYMSQPPPVTHAVIKSYHDGPMPILSTSMHNVAALRDGNYINYHQGRPELHNNIGSQPIQKVPSGLSLGSRVSSGNMVTLSESNLLSINSQQNYNPYNSKMAFLHGNRVNSDRTDHSHSNSSSSESVSSSRDFTNHASYPLVSPQKHKRGGIAGSKMECHYATSYRPHDSRVRTLYACLGENDGELSFEPNQIITNVRPSMEPGWLEGTLNGKTGLIPENYVEVLP
ncbi:rho GTPase-activating protein 26 isoform X2 [Anabrus simplex]|uniref:rho GTPase-activating protein 26 isoform X2 n=1 Tax=Anabrus simplex TaxID=316456 RepID=UPI0035A33EB2